jgi:hypothetical protein
MRSSVDEIGQERRVIEGQRPGPREERDAPHAGHRRERGRGLGVDVRGHEAIVGDDLAVDLGELDAGGAERGEHGGRERRLELDGDGRASRPRRAPSRGTQQADVERAPDLGIDPGGLGRGVGRESRSKEERREGRARERAAKQRHVR